MNESKDLRKNNPLRWEDIKENVAVALEEAMTDPTYDKKYRDPHSVISSIREGKKIGFDRLDYQTVIKIGQDLRLSPDEIDMLIDKIFEKQV